MRPLVVSTDLLSPLMFGRRSRLDQELSRFVRSDTALIDSLIAAVSTSRSDAGLPVPVTELPITVGASTLHSDTLAAMPARAAGLVDQRVTHLLDRPDPTTDYRAVVHAITHAMFWHGYAAILLDRPAPLTTSIRVLDPGSVHFDTTTSTWMVHGTPIAAERIYPVSLLNDPSRGPLGESPLVRCSDALGMYGYAYRYLIDFFANGGNPGSILKSTTPMSPERSEDLVSKWVTARQARRPAVMDSTVSLEIPASSGELAAVLSVLDHGAAETARLLNMPGSLVNAPSAGYSLTYANVSDEMRRWIALSLRPTWMARIESMFRALTGNPTIYLDTADLLDTYDSLTADLQELPSNV